MNNNELELIPRADILMESMRSIGYTFQSAVADIIDNSISADATEVDIIFNPTLKNILFIDNGYGMSEDELVEAMRFGSKDPLETRNDNDLGRFGLGLKSSSLSQCRKFVVVSKYYGKINAFCWDLDVVRNNGNWSVIKLTNNEIDNIFCIDKLKEKETGTLVMWEKFDKIKITSGNIVESLEQELNYCADYLALIYHRYISSSFTIRINGRPIEKIDPFLTNNTHTQLLKAEDIPIKDKNGTTHYIKVYPYVLPHFNSLSVEEKRMLGSFSEFRNQQGFYIYRNKRLIIWGKWFRMTGTNELYKNARVRVDIPNSLDEIWSIDVKKSTATIPLIIRQKLQYAVKEAINTSQNIYIKRAINVNKGNGYDCVWNTEVSRDKKKFVINRDLPMLQKLTEDLEPNKIKLLDMILKDIEDNIPRYNIYTQISKGDELDDAKDNDIVNRLLDFVNIMKPKNKEDLKNLIKPIISSEPYCKVENIEKLIMKEYLKIQ